MSFRPPPSYIPHETQPPRSITHPPLCYYLPAYYVAFGAHGPRQAVNPPGHALKIFIGTMAACGAAVGVFTMIRSAGECWVGTCRRGALQSVRNLWGLGWLGWKWEKEAEKNGKPDHCRGLAEEEIMGGRVDFHTGGVTRSPQLQDKLR